MAGTLLTSNTTRVNGFPPERVRTNAKRKKATSFQDKQTPKIFPDDINNRHVRVRVAAYTLLQKLRTH